ncbi:A-kinase anchor protein 2 isoform X4 [Polypterus senegalus]|uniref:A-kinase anchor protein 2 isoform X4 n=1 Tax=Polypterus senegalus TaxID=55291 RepID=UPI0019641048|nr:A-kinase anchor protein 2 isoform X4 [Polypterus senegalus]
MGMKIHKRAAFMLDFKRMAEAELHKERLQALTEKRKRQAEIEEKRRQLEDLILQLQHLKSKAMRERWLLQGTPAVTTEEEEFRRKQVEEDELRVKKLEDSIHILENEIEHLEREESQISAKEQILREKLRETEKSIEDLQKSILRTDGDAVNYVYSQIPDISEVYCQRPTETSGDERLQRKAAMYAMEINVEKDRQTGETKILSTSAVNPEGIHQRGVKVYDDGTKVVYEVKSAGTTTLENGVHPWSSSDVDELMQRVGQTQIRGDSERVTVSTRGQANTSSGNPGVQVEQMVHKEAKLEMIRNQGKGVSENPSCGFDEVTEVPEATSEKPVTMIFMGYHNVEDEEETKKLLGYDGTIKAEIVLIDEDDEKSLREKTVTDISTMDGNAADLVSGRPLSDTTEPSSEGKDESSAKELPTAGWDACPRLLLMEEYGETLCDQTAMKSSKLTEDDRDLKKDKGVKSVSFLEPISIFSGSKRKMEVEAPFPEKPAQSQYTCLPSSDQNGLKVRHESLDSDVAKEIQYLDEVLEANCCDSMNETFNGMPSPRATALEASSPSVSVSGRMSPSDNDVIVIGRRQVTCVEATDGSQMKSNGHSVPEHDDPNLQSNQRSAVDPSLTTIKKEARFELRAFHEEKKPSKLFDSSMEKEIVRVKKIRPSEEIAELERERRELIRSQAVKKNPGIAAKWWNPPQEKTILEQLDPEQLESHKKYEERKQRKQDTSTALPSPKQNQTIVTQSEPLNVKKDDIVTEQIDFSAARKQFLMMETPSQPSAPKRSVAPKMYSAKPFCKAPEQPQMEKLAGSVTVTGSSSYQDQSEAEVTTIRAEKIYYVPDKMDETTLEENSKASNDPNEGFKDERWEEEEEDVEFTCARAVMTILKDEEHDMPYVYAKSVTVSSHPEELDSGLDDLSLRSQDTTILETLSNDFSMDNVSDSGASNETMNAFLENSLGDFSLPPTPQAVTPIDCKMEGSAKTPADPVMCPLPGTYNGVMATDEQLEYHAGILVDNAIQQAIAQQSHERSVTVQEPTTPEVCIQEAAEKLPPIESEEQTAEQVSPMRVTCQFQPPQVSSPVQGPAETCDQHAVDISSERLPTEDKQEFSYFSKYSQAAELRSTASVLKTQEPELNAGPFKLRSRKQQTLSMIEEEIRAAQEREEELRRQRQRVSAEPSPTKKSGPNLPTRIACSGKTVPGKIEKLRPVPPVSPSAEGPLPSPLSDGGSEETGGNHRPKNFMQTLMEDYETHKVRRREKVEDTSVLEATRVTRRKSSMALRWEAGIYANRDENE